MQEKARLDTASDKQIAKKEQFLRLRERAGLSNRQVAAKCEVHETTVSRWSTGDAEVPGAVIAYLRLRVTVIDRLRKLADDAGEL